MTHESEHPMDLASDEDVMRLVKKDREDAFDLIYKRYRSRVYGYLHGKLGASPLVDDIFQKTFLNVFRYRKKFDPNKKFASWLFSIAHNTMIDAIRHEKAEQKRRENADFGHSQHEKGSKVEIEDLLSQLSERERKMVTARYIEENDFDEIAIKHNTNAQNVRKIISRSLSKLRNFKWNT